MVKKIADRTMLALGKATLKASFLVVGLLGAFYVIKNRRSQKE